MPTCGTILLLLVYYCSAPALVAARLGPPRTKAFTHACCSCVNRMGNWSPMVNTPAQLRTVLRCCYDASCAAENRRGSANQHHCCRPFVGSAFRRQVNHLAYGASGYEYPPPCTVLSVRCSQLSLFGCDIHVFTAVAVYS